MYPALWGWRQPKKDFILSVYVTKLLVNAGRGFSLKSCCKWLCIWPAGRHFKIKILPKDPNSIWNCSALCQWKEGWFLSHSDWTTLEKKQAFFPGLPGSQADSDWSIQAEERAALIDQSCIGCDPCQCKIITYSHCPPPQLSCINVKAKVTSNASILFLRQLEANSQPRAAMIAGTVDLSLKNIITL